MPLVTTEAIILQAFPYSDTSKILRLLTATHGVRSAMARGALRPRSRYGGVLEPFTKGTATFYLKEGRDLHTLSAFELIRPRQELGRDLLRFGVASLLAEILMRTASETPDRALYDHADRALAALAEAPEDRLPGVALARLWALIGQLGFAPALDGCQVCSRVVPPDADVFFDYAAGGIHCQDCGGGAVGRVLPADARRALLAYGAGEEVPPGEAAPAHWQLLIRFLGYHLTDLGSLRSLKFLADAMETG
ncbi:MAG TPA: DNA repair protein RecO [Longimicrobiales bacterium]|nr:DNA repair protein RecO [Longimicrobiales bacterium]